MRFWPLIRSGRGCVAILSVLPIFTNQTQDEYKESFGKTAQKGREIPNVTAPLPVVQPRQRYKDNIERSRTRGF